MLLTDEPENCSRPPVVPVEFSKFNIKHMQKLYAVVYKHEF